MNQADAVRISAREASLKAARRRCETQLMGRDVHTAYANIVATVQDAVGVYGKHGLAIVPYYLLMAEVGLELGHLKQVEEVLALSIWSLVRSAEESSANEGETHPGTLLQRAAVCKLYGRFHAEAENYDEALKQAANGAYYASLVHGPEHILTSTLYYTLGCIFQRMFKTEQALGLFDKLVEIWYKYLANRPPSAESKDRGHDDDDDALAHERLLHEGNAMLLHILDTRAKVLGAGHIATGEVEYTMGLLKLHMGCRSDAKGFLDQALSIYTDALGSLHPSTIDVQSVIDQVRDV
ncbi:hypothetical protein SPRG_12167 [Saprolegnia parasitica CBS 223.65]|uniref:MalT-like TPR region domain-containing protein n=1 Tax=Saprolegnia parasitica (strain CBS 223.65) TaxID=695850 RepID=A0A067C0W7_SAPPC|nr:hypothetical protein SPRG_12167 [Saprolegnia parasitica CBS 223.65]KDO22740.1 hypothetical protein SPRG_12167 [Saprolegnia parasitica CBS 223.65]|eukprot:XP_012206528.1 hypothetical protein SPRG_12167 [Saprolegnia parasitica CBS 223.65]